MMKTMHLTGRTVVGEDVGYSIWASRGLNMYWSGLSLVSDDLTGQSFNPNIN